MCSLFFSAFLALYSWRQGNVVLGLLLIPSIFFYSLAYEINDSELTRSYFDHAYVVDYSIYIIFGLMQVLSIVIALNRRYSGRMLDLAPPTLKPSFSISRSILIYYLLAGVSLLSFIVNLSNVSFSIELLFISPRIYEESFGQSTLFNYLYFLNIPALCISIYLRQQELKPHGAGYIDSFLIVISLFHGIKFTVFDTVLLPALFYFHCNKHPQIALRMLGLALSILLAFYLIFSTGVRGFVDGDESPLYYSVLNYILPNYYNFAYVIQQQPLQFEPFALILPDKIPNPFLSILSPGQYGFLLNDRFNMATAYSEIYAALPPLSWLLVIPIIIRLRLKVMRLKRQTQAINWIFIAAYIDFCLFFFWYFYAFTKTKYVYYIFVMILIGYLIHRHNSKRLSKKPSKTDAVFVSANSH